MGTRRKRRRQEALWVATTDLPQTVAHPFYRRVNALLDAHGFDAFVERHCQRFYAATRGRPSLTPGIYFRALLVGYFEGIDSERGIAWRAADSLAIRRFLGIAVDEAVPDHSTISRTRCLIDVETHRTVFTWVQRAEREGLETLHDRELGGLDAALDGALLAVEQLQLAEAEQVAWTVQPFLRAVPRHLVVLAQEGRQSEGLEMGVEQQGRLCHHSAPTPSSVR